MRRLRLIPVLAAIAVSLWALPAGAYQLLSLHAAVSGVQPEHWESLPVSVVIDQGPAGFTSEVQSALGKWNAVATARDPFGTPSLSPVDFTDANLGSAWGDLSGDGRQEVVYDTDGKAITALGFAPAAVNGFGPRHEVVRNGQAVIDDMFLVIVGSHADFDRPSTELHELGHTIGLAHSSTGWAEGKDGALSPLLSAQLPTMHPFAAGPDRGTLEADDAAALSELYPEPSFSSLGTVSGQVVRCGTNNPVSGAQVRLVNAANLGVQLSRVTGFDGDTNGLYTIKGVPEGDYFAVVEPLAGDDEMFDRLALFTNVETDFTQEYFNPPDEDNCADDDDPNARQTIHVGPGGSATVNFKVEGASLALVIDTTASMGPELSAAKVALETMVTALQAVPGEFPKTALVTFRDDATVDLVTRDPDKLRDKIAGLTTSHTTDCPEESNRALMTAGRLLGTNGRAILVTDAESRPTGPSRRSVEDLYASKGIQLSTLLSDDTCMSAPLPRSARARVVPAIAPAGDGAAPEQARPVDQLGNETPIRTFGEETLASGGLFSFQPEIKQQDGTVPTRFSDTLANLALAAVRPTVTALEPGSAPQGTVLRVELTGSGTSFAPGSTVGVGGTGVQASAVDVQSPTRIAVTLTVAADAALGLRDVTVSSGSGKTATGIGALEIVAAPATATLLSVAPASLAAGTTEDVTISGALTHFGATTVPAFGADVQVNHVTAGSATSLVANVTVAPAAAAGLRSVRVTTGAEDLTYEGAFVITPAVPVPRLTGVSPRSGARGSTVEVEITGADTAFVDGASAALVSGDGVQVLSTGVTGPTEAFAQLTIAPDAPLGLRDLTVRTGDREAVLRDSFDVVPAAQPAPTPIATASPLPATHVPTTCADLARPRASLKRVSVKRRKLTLQGRASDAGCTAEISVAGHVARVEAAISRKAGQRCRFAGRNGKLGKPRKCSRPVWLKAKGTTTWSLVVKRKLPRGKYRVLVRARDSGGNVSAAPAKRTVRVR
jgi:hypothetical protein